MAGLTRDPLSIDTPLVQKYGGSSFTDLDGFLRVARHVAGRIRAERRPVVVVVSAMSGTTGHLQEVLHLVNPEAPAEVAAVLLTAGETVSAALLAAAFHAIGLPARALPADGIGFTAAGPADRAALEYVDSAVLRAELASCPVLVIPGGQAVDPDGRTVMLGRNSSDLSAVAAAAALGAPVCEFFSDVPGVCTADPHVVPEARTLPQVSYATMRLLSSSGAKVLHEGAVAYAEDTGVRLHCCSLPPEARCATIVAAGQPAAAVVLHRHGEVWRFPEAATRRAAAAALTAEGLDPLAVDVDGQLYVVVGADGHRAVAERCVVGGRSHPDLRLLTTVGHDGRATHALVPQHDAAAEARRQHRRLYPDTAPAPDIGAKLRSDHSDVLVTASGGPGAAAPSARQ